MGVSSNSKIEVLKLQMTLGSSIMFVKDGAQKEGVFTTIFGAKIEKNWFFQFFSILYSILLE